MTSPRVTPEGLLGVTDDPAAALRYPSDMDAAATARSVCSGGAYELFGRHGDDREDGRLRAITSSFEQRYSWSMTVGPSP